MPIYIDRFFIDPFKRSSSQTKILIDELNKELSYLYNLTDETKKIVHEYMLRAYMEGLMKSGNCDILLEEPDSKENY